MFICRSTLGISCGQSMVSRSLRDQRVVKASQACRHRSPNTNPVCCASEGSLLSIANLYTSDFWLMAYTSIACSILQLEPTPILLVSAYLTSSLASSTIPPTTSSGCEW